MCTPFTDSQLRRFKARYVERGPDDCWLWTGAIIKNTPQWHYARCHRISARQVALALVGKLTDKCLIRTTCGNPLCVNPRHLEVMKQQTRKNTSKNGKRAEIMAYEAAQKYYPLVAAWLKFMPRTAIAKRLGVSAVCFNKYFREVLDNPEKYDIVQV